MYIAFRNVGFRFLRIMVSKTFVVSDIIKYDGTEHNYSGAVTDVYPYPNQAYALPNHFKWQFKLMNKSNYSGNNIIRLFLHPSTDTAPAQPNYGLWEQFENATRCNGGSRVNGSTVGDSSYVTVSLNAWVDMEIEVDGTTVTFRINGTDVGTVTKTWITNYTDWVIRLLANNVGNWAYKDLKIIPL